MYGLLYKELVTNRKILLVMLGMILLIHAVVLTPALSPEEEEAPGLFIVTACILAASLASFYAAGIAQLNIFGTDERKKWGCYVISAEDGIRKAVGARYLFVLLISVAVMVLCRLIGSLTTDLFTLLSEKGLAPEEYAQMPGFMYSVTLMYFLFPLQILLRAIDMPFLYAFGHKAGDRMKGFFLLGILFFVIVWLLFGNISVLGTTDDFWERFFAMLEGEENDWVSVGIGCFMTAVYPLYYLSYRISCKYYAKGVEQYEQ